MRGWLYLLLGIVGILVLMQVTGIGHYASLQDIQSHTHYWTNLVDCHYFKAVIIYICTTMISVMVGLPAVMPLSLLAGLLFGLYAGTVYTVLSVMCASILTFLLFRFVFHSFLSRRYAAMLDQWKIRMNKMGTSYFLVLYFSSVVPTLFINVLAAVSSISLTLFIVLTFIGSLPIIMIFAAAGNRLTTITSVYDIFSPEIILLFVLLIIAVSIPLIMRYFVPNNIEQ